jgi:hypothetical protein
MANNTAIETVEAAIIEAESTDDTATASGVTDVVAIIQSLNNPESGFYSSIKSEDFADRLAVASALTTSQPIDENLGTTIHLTNFIVQPIELADDEGTVNTAPRVVLIDADGTAYHATSVGLLSSLRNIISVLGEPESWPKPIDIQVTKQQGRNGYKFFTIKFV